MADDALKESWDRTRGHLDRAWVAMPPGDDGHRADYREYLDHNELELAMDALAEAATERGASTEVWKALTAAAREMGLARSFPR